jgi:hypothetical protein
MIVTPSIKSTSNFLFNWQSSQFNFNLVVLDLTLNKLVSIIGTSEASLETEFDLKIINSF